MKKPTKENQVEDPNIVMFPASKNFEKRKLPIPTHQDPLEELLNEFEEESEEERWVELNHHVSPENYQAKSLNDKIEYLTQLQSKVRFYLDEIEQYIPQKKK